MTGERDFPPGIAPDNQKPEEISVIAGNILMMERFLSDCLHRERAKAAIIL